MTDVLDDEHLVEVTASPQEAMALIEAWLSRVTAEEAADSRKPRGDAAVTQAWRPHVDAQGDQRD